MAKVDDTDILSVCSSVELLTGGREGKWEDIAVRYSNRRLIL